MRSYCILSNSKQDGCANGGATSRTCTSLPQPRADFKQTFCATWPAPPSARRWALVRGVVPFPASLADLCRAACSPALESPS